MISRGLDRKRLASRAPEIWAAAALYFALTLILTYPLSVTPHRTVIAHNSDDEEVMWIIGWDVHAFTHHPLSIFDANILYPEPRTLAYAENLIGSALIAAPVLWLSGNLVLAINVVVLLSCTLCGLGAYVLGRRLGMSVPAALLCGVIFAYSPPRFMRNVQIHVGAVQWIPFALASLHTYLDEGRRRDLWLAVAFVTLQALTNGHGAVFAGVAVAFLLAYRMLLGEPLLVLRGVRDLGVVGLLLSIPAVAIFLQYRAVQGTLLGGSSLGNWWTTPESFLASPTPLHKLIRPFITSTDVNAAASAWLFPGYLPLALAVVAILWGRRIVGVDDQPGGRAWVRAALLVEAATLASLVCAIAASALTPIRWRISDTQMFTARSSGRAWLACAALFALRVLMLRRAPFDLLARGRLFARWAAVRRGDPTVLYFLMAAFCVWVAFGPPSPFWRLGLWRFIYDWPGLTFVRATSRFTVLGLLAVAVLAGIGFDRLVLRRGPIVTLVLGMVAGVMLVLEFAMVPITATPFRLDIPAADQWVARQPAPFVVAEVPINRRLQTVYMLHSMAHWQKTVHGTARVIPEANQELFRDLLTFPDLNSLRRLQQFGVTYVIVHTDLYAPEHRAPLDERLRAFAPSLKLEYMDPAGRVYSLQPSSETAKAGRAYSRLAVRP